MEQKKIKFSHKYVKMPHHVVERKDPVAKLLEVFVTFRKELSDAFIDYDTRTLGGERYELPNSKVLVLLLQSPAIEWDRGEVWTTVRRWTVEKEQYYRGLRGQVLSVQIIEEKCARILK